MSASERSSEPTAERLARAMAQALCPISMVKRAREGYYDDYRSDLAMPLVQLVDELRGIGQHALAERVVAGEFDGTKEESDAWARSPEGQATFRELARGAGKQRRPREQPVTEQPRERKISVESIFGHANRRPLVNLLLPDGLDRLSLAPDEARDLALNLLQAAEASLGDGFVFEFFSKEMDLPESQAAGLMLKLRGYRQRHEAAGT